MTRASSKGPYDETAVANANWAAFQRGYDNGHATYVKEATKFSDFYSGRQWEADVEAKLVGEGKPVLTINVAKKTINTIDGIYANSRADIVFKPSRDATAEQARTMTHLVDQILQSNKYEHIERNVARDGWIMDRGFLEVRVNFDENILGEIEIKDVDPRDVVLDPDAKDYDPRTWGECTVSRWLSMDDIEGTYGVEMAEKARGYVQLYGSRGTYGSESVRFGTPKNATGTPQVYVPGHNAAEDEKRIRAIRVVDRQYRKMGKVTEFVDLESGDVSEVPSTWDQARVQAVAERYGLVIRTRMKSRIRWTVTVDHVVLHDDWSPYDRFTIIPYFPYFQRGNPTGVMRDLVSPQEQLNKTESQELHIINTTANSGWMVPAGALVNMTEEELEERGAETGLVIVYAANKGEPTKIQPNHIPTGIDRVSQKSYGYISEIPGLAPLANPAIKSEVSGVAYNRASDNALSTLRGVFDNLDFTRELLADVLVCFIQKYYTEARVLRVTDWRHPEQPEIDLEINTDLLNNVTIGKYDVIATSAPAQDTQEDREFAQMIEMRNSGITTIPDYHVILASNIKNKQAIAEESKRVQGFAEPSEEEQQIQQITMQLEIENAQAKIAELQAQAEELMAEAMLHQAKAQAALSAEEREVAALQSGRELEMQKIRKDIATTIANLENKLQLAGMHVGAKRENTRYTSQMKNMEGQLDRETTLAIEGLRSASKSAPQGE